MTCVYDVMKYAYGAIFQMVVVKEYTELTAQRRSPKGGRGAADQLESGSWIEKKVPMYDNDVSPEELSLAPTLAHLEETSTARAFVVEGTFQALEPYQEAYRRAWARVVE